MDNLDRNKSENLTLIKDIDRNIEIVNAALKWAEDYQKDSFPKEQFKEFRRELTKKRLALLEPTSAAAYGESQVGKSYLMSSLLSTESKPFVISNDGKDYSFIYDLNDSGGNNTKVESTGLITRFTLDKDPTRPSGMVKITNLSVVDIILILLDSYYNDVKVNPDSVLSTDQINNELETLTLLRNRKDKNGILNEDDIKNIFDYIRDLVGGATTLYKSNFCKIVGPAIAYVPSENWIAVFSIMWNHNEQLNKLFSTLIDAYRRLNFQRVVYVPFDALLRKNGTLLKIDWLDAVCGAPVAPGNEGYKMTTNVYDANGKLIASDFNKSDLSALTAEITLELPEEIAEQRSFLKYMDLLDFPGARSRENFKEESINTVLPQMLRRGKVAYLFNKYSRALQIGSVLFCHHNDQKTEPTLSETITSWLENNNNVGKTPSDRAKMLRHTNNVSPLFFIATKFNIDLEKTRNDKPDSPESLDKHWNRFETVFPEIVKPNTWLDKWSVSTDGKITPFRSIYPLRDFYWSGKNGLFEGYSDGDTKSPEKARINPADYPEYFDDLKKSFLENEFVKAHFDNPETTWESVAAVGNDGSKPIIRDLNKIAPVLDEARRKKFIDELKKIKEGILKTLDVYFEPTDSEEKNKKLQRIAGDLRLAFNMLVATNPGAFGRIIDSLMVSPEELRNIAFNIIICHLDTPKDFGKINFIRALAEIDLKDTRENNVNKLLKIWGRESEDELKDYLNLNNYPDLEEIITEEAYTLSSIGDVVTQHFIGYWINHLNSVATALSERLPHSEEIVYMLISLFEKLDVRKKLATTINRYTEVFGENEQPNAIGDYAALEFNNFVSTVGRSFMSDIQLDDLKAKADNCKIPIDFSPAGWNRKASRQDLKATLKAFDAASTVINEEKIDLEVLRQLPFWNNYLRWENFIIIGLIFSSDISRVDPACNERVREMIDETEKLYKQE